MEPDLSVRAKAIPSRRRSLLELAIVGAGLLFVFPPVISKTIDIIRNLSGFAFVDSSLLTYLVMLFLGGLLVVRLYVVAGNLRYHGRLENEAIPVSAVVTDRRSARDSEGGRRYYLTYAYRNGLEVETKVNRQQYEQFIPGSQIQVRYLPDDPRVSTVDWERTQASDVV
jgi:hypothetical protein